MGLKVLLGRITVLWLYASTSQAAVPELGCCIMARTKMPVRSLRSALNIVIIYHIYHQYNLLVMMNNFPSSHLPQSGAMQLVVRWSGPSHGAPPYWLDCRMTLVELCRPVPQVAEHRLHSDQLDHSQSTAGGQSGRRVQTPLGQCVNLASIYPKRCV